MHLYQMILLIALLLKMKIMARKQITLLK